MNRLLISVLMALLLMQSTARAFDEVHKRPIDPRPDLQRSLYSAISEDDFKEVELLLNKGAGVNFSNKSSGGTPLHSAIVAQKRKTPNIEEIIKMLEASGAVDEPEKKEVEAAPKPKEK